MNCAKISCSKGADDVVEANVAGVNVKACKEHLDGLSRNHDVASRYAHQTRVHRQFQILMEALRGPAADTRACMTKLDELIDAERNTQQAVLDWLRTASGGLPS